MFREMRRRKQAVDESRCIELLTSEKRGALGVNGEDGYPYVIPINFYFESGDTKHSIYFHSAIEGHKVDAIRQSNKVCFTVWNSGTLKDDWAPYVQSVVAFGRAYIVEDEEAKEKYTRLLGLKYYPNAEDVELELKRDLNRMNLYRIDIEHMTGKQIHER